MSDTRYIGERATPLLVALYDARIETVKFLAGAKADVFTRTQARTPFLLLICFIFVLLFVCHLFFFSLLVYPPNMFAERKNAVDGRSRKLQHAGHRGSHLGKPRLSCDRGNQRYRQRNIPIPAASSPFFFHLFVNGRSPSVHLVFCRTCGQPSTTRWRDTTTGNSPACCWRSRPTWTSKVFVFGETMPSTRTTRYVRTHLFSFATNVRPWGKQQLRS